MRVQENCECFCYFFYFSIGGLGVKQFFHPTQFSKHKALKSGTMPNGVSGSDFFFGLKKGNFINHCTGIAPYIVHTISIRVNKRGNIKGDC